VFWLFRRKLFKLFLEKGGVQMRKVIFVICFLVLPFVSFAETIILKSGEKMERDIIERTDEYIKIDFYGSIMSYALDEIESIDGKKVVVPPEQDMQRESYSHEEPKSEVSHDTKEAYKEEEVPERPSSYSQDQREELFSPTEEDLKTIQEVGAGLGALMGMIFLISVPISILMIASFWKIFTKAGQPGWPAIVPIYNIYVLLMVARKPGWWLLLFFLPLVSAVISIIVYIDVAKNFGKGTGFGIGMVLLPWVFWPILAFGNAQYTG